MPSGGKVITRCPSRHGRLGKGGLLYLGSWCFVPGGGFSDPIVAHDSGGALCNSRQDNISESAMAAHG